MLFGVRYFRDSVFKRVWNRLWNDTVFESVLRSLETKIFLLIKILTSRKFIAKIVKLIAILFLNRKRL